MRDAKQRRSSQLSRIKSLMTRVTKAEARAAKSRRRFAHYRYLKIVYRGYCELEEARSLKRLRRHLVRHYDVSEDAHAIRMMIDATTTEPDKRLRSRWTRALEYAWNEEVAPEDLIAFFRRNKGIAGCARLASRALPRGKSRRTSEDDWSDDSPEHNPLRYEREHKFNLTNARLPFD